MGALYSEGVGVKPNTSNYFTKKTYSNSTAEKASLSYSFFLRGRIVVRFHLNHIKKGKINKNPIPIPSSLMILCAQRTRQPLKLNEVMVKTNLLNASVIQG